MVVTATAHQFSPVLMSLPLDIDDTEFVVVLSTERLMKSFLSEVCFPSGVLGGTKLIVSCEVWECGPRFRRLVRAASDDIVKEGGGSMINRVAKT